MNSQQVIPDSARPPPYDSSINTTNEPIELVGSVIGTTTSDQSVLVPPSTGKVMLVVTEIPWTRRILVTVKIILLLLIMGGVFVHINRLAYASSMLFTPKVHHIINEPKIDHIIHGRHSHSGLVERLRRMVHDEQPVFEGNDFSNFNDQPAKSLGSEKLLRQRRSVAEIKNSFRKKKNRGSSIQKGKVSSQRSQFDLPA